MIVFECIMSIVLIVSIIIGYSFAEEKDMAVLLIGLSMSFGLFFSGLLTDYAGITIHKSNEKGYNVWKEETKIGDKVVKTTWHVAHKK